VPLIEDDPYRDLRYAGEHLPTIKSFDHAGNVIFITSTSKILCPGLRVGAAYVPETLVPMMTVAKQAADMHSATLPQAIVSEFISRELLDPHIARVCKNYRRRIDAMRGAIAAYFPESVEATAPEGGLFVWCACPDGVDAAVLLERAITQKVAFIPGEQFFAGGGGKNAFRMNFTSAAYGDIEKGVEILGRLLRGAIDKL
jgi:2-aminoadipate transaminase